MDNNAPSIKPSSDGSKVSQYLDYICGKLDAIAEEAELPAAEGEDF